MNNITVIRNKTIDYVLLGILGLLTLFFLLELVLSLSWRMQHDAPLIFYVAFLINRHDYTLYRDIFETSMIGTFLFHMAIGKFFGYSDPTFRIVDVSYLLILLGCTWFLMRPLGKVIAFTAPLLFGISYLGYGSIESLQRDYIGILPIAIALLLVTKDFGAKKGIHKAFIVGALFAFSSSIKPHLAIGLPALIIYISLNDSSKEHKEGKISYFRHSLQFGFFAASGFVLILSLPFIWLWSKGGGEYFWEIFSMYLPLHIHLTGSHETISGLDRWIYLFRSYLRLGGTQIVLTPIALGVYLAFSELEKISKIKFVVLLLTLLFLYSIYPVFAGQFWDYHWIPFVYFSSLCASLLLLPASQYSFSSYRRVIPLVFFMIFILFSIRASVDLVRQVTGNWSAPPKVKRADEIADFLRSNLRPTDKVQPLDWTGGAVHGMLLSEAVVATPYIYDYHFYHHISEPYIQEIRRRFIEQLKEEKPRFIIDIATKPRPWGEDTTEEFPELQKFMDKNYIIVYEGDGFNILESR